MRYFLQLLLKAIICLKHVFKCGLYIVKNCKNSHLYDISIFLRFHNNNNEVFCETISEKKLSDIKIKR